MISLSQCTHTLIMCIAWDWKYALVLKNWKFFNLCSCCCCWAMKWFPCVQRPHRELGFILWDSMQRFHTINPYAITSPIGCTRYIYLSIEREWDSHAIICWCIMISTHNKINLHVYRHKNASLTQLILCVTSFHAINVHIIHINTSMNKS